ncbi:MAG: EamA family transporter [Rhizobiaceae bacterium]|nr:EamA family transporter [Rhizobiaceae bacterium]
MFARVAPIIFVCLWATGFVGARMGMPHSEPGTFLSLRFAVAFVLLTLIVLVIRAPWPGTRTGLKSIVIGFLIHGSYLGPVFWVIDRGMPAGVTAVVVGLQPLFTALLAGWWLHEVITPRHWVGLAIGMVGVCLVLYPGIDLASSGVNVVTITVCLLGMLSVTLGTVLQKSLSSMIDLRSGTALQYLGAFIPVFILALVSETGSIDWTGEMILAMTWSIIALSLFAIFLLMWLIREGSVAKVSSLFFLVPAVAALMSYALFGETFDQVQLVGMVLCAVAVALAASRKSGNRQVAVSK